MAWLQILLDFDSTEYAKDQTAKRVDTTPLEHDGEVLPDLWRLFPGQSFMTDVGWSSVTYATPLPEGTRSGDPGVDFCTVDAVCYGNQSSEALVFDFSVGDEMSDAEFAESGEPIAGPVQIWDRTDYAGLRYVYEQPTYRWFQISVDPIDCEEDIARLDALAAEIADHDAALAEGSSRMRQLSGQLELLEAHHSGAADIATASVALFAAQATILVAGAIPTGLTAIAVAAAVAGIEAAANGSDSPSTAAAREGFRRSVGQAVDAFNDGIGHKGAKLLSKGVKGYVDLQPTLEFGRNARTHHQDLIDAALRAQEARTQHASRLEERDQLHATLAQRETEREEDFLLWASLDAALDPECRPEAPEDPAEALAIDAPTDVLPLEASPDLQRLRDQFDAPVEATLFDLPSASRTSLRSGASDDIAVGGRADETLRLGRGDDMASAGRGDDRLLGQAGNDFLMGGRGRDLVRGGAGDDIVAGGQGADRLFGGRGDDLILGDQGCDVLTGGRGADVFEITRDPGNRRCSTLIRDFQPNRDKLDVEDLRYRNFADLSDDLSQQGRDVVLKWRGRELVTLEDVRLARLDADDFLI
ncbi:MAG: calcium-binding protein [Pseudomonadota bacterium]